MTYEGFEEDWKLILSAAREMDQYLTSNVLLWPLSGQNMPLTPGNLLLAKQRIKAAGDKSVNSEIDAIESIYSKHFSAWEEKLTGEIHLRMNQWKNQMDEIVQQGSVDKTYVYNVRVRVILSLLGDEMPDEFAKVKDRLNEMDGILLTLTRRDGFVWDGNLKSAFPQDSYPFLYLTGSK